MLLNAKLICTHAKTEQSFECQNFIFYICLPITTVEFELESRTALFWRGEQISIITIGRSNNWNNFIMEAIRKGRGIIRARRRFRCATVSGNQELSTPVISFSSGGSGDVSENTVQEVEAQECDNSASTISYAEVYIKLLKNVGVIPHNCIRDERSNSTDFVRKVSPSSH